jgi:hypothetical protein
VTAPDRLEWIFTGTMVVPAAQTPMINITHFQIIRAVYVAVVVQTSVTVGLDRIDEKGRQQHHESNYNNEDQTAAARRIVKAHHGNVGRTKLDEGHFRPFVQSRNVSLAAIPAVVVGLLLRSGR